MNKETLPGDKRIKFGINELAGSVGDFGTIFPIILGVALVSNVNLSTIFLFFAIWYALVGVYYNMPIPVEPMKAIGAVVIAEGLSAPEIAASGIIIGVMFLLIGYLRGMKKIQRFIPESVIRGVQAGLAILLLKTSFGFVINDLTFALISVFIVLLFMILSLRTKIPDLSALIIIGIGIATGFFAYGIPNPKMIAIPEIVIPETADFVFSAWHLVIPQIPLTLTNAILATSLLAFDLFKRDAEPDKLSKTIGAMNIISCPLGGFPMCHGAGGLAAQYRFGARTGGSNVFAGIIMLGFAFFFATPEMLRIIPTGIFAGLLIFVALTLGKSASKTDSWPVTILIGILTPFTGITFAFAGGMLLAYFEKFRVKKNRNDGNRM
ncbi:sulfate transporter [Methanoplanus sp. FWC-SCC4]|uniref:Sulfate transporter n=1 Tax=Methanochimaera problematica TaxID=2609417 RepID=A0AA97FAH7_9EURY|nr:putative sulfate/molybdate transporter [Methanoplanus sp. FWC-SCC4]WOF15327.1 sulfate transporter [Methanoplanus sp. FWC-SCC4]